MDILANPAAARRGFTQPWSRELWPSFKVRIEDAPHTRHPSRFSIIWIENIWNNWILILLEWAVVAQWPGDPPWPPPGCRAVTGITTWSSEEEKQKGSFVLYPALCWVAGHSWVACSMFSYLNIYTIQFHFTNLSFNAIWLLYHCLGNVKGFFFLPQNKHHIHPWVLQVWADEG